MLDFSDFYPQGEGGAAALSYRVVAVNSAILPFEGLYVDTTAAVAITLPVAVDNDKVFIGDLTGGADLMPIVITPDGTDTIMGAATFTINVAYQMFEFVKVGTDWKFSGGVGEGAGGGETPPSEGVDLTADYAWTGLHTHAETLTTAKWLGTGVGGGATDTAGRVVIHDETATDAVTFNGDVAWYADYAETYIGKIGFTSGTHSSMIWENTGGGPSAISVGTWGWTFRGDGVLATQAGIQIKSGTDPVTQSALVQWQLADDTPVGYVGQGSGGQDKMFLLANTGDVEVTALAGEVIIAGGSNQDWIFNNAKLVTPLTAEIGDINGKHGMRWNPNDGTVIFTGDAKPLTFNIGGRTGTTNNMVLNGNGALELKADLVTASIHAVTKRYSDATLLSAVNNLADQLEAQLTVTIDRTALTTLIQGAT